MGQGSFAHKEAQNAQVALNLVPAGGRETIHERFERQVLATPDAIAVSFAGERLTYRELNERANRLAHHLRGLGVGPETCVGILVERSLELVVSILGVLKAGGCYLPLDRAYPVERLSFMLDDSRAALLIAGDEATAAMFEHRLPVVCLEAFATQSAENLPHVTAPENLAYVIYTSGSTGQPKGVAVSHANVARLFDATQAWFKFDERDVWTLFHSSAFDFSVWELWGALLYGGRLVVVPFAVSRDPASFYELLRQERVTVLNQTPSAFWQLSQAEEDLPKRDLALRLIIFGGEALELQRLRPWFERHGDDRPRLVNMYGITETTVHVTYRPITRDDLNAGSVIGSAIPDLAIYLLDDNLRPVADGLQGEMYVGGAGLARGYLHRPDLTAERFVPDPFGGEPGARLYRTGDVARRTREGDLEYHGRVDEQVKIRGFRIEPAEVNAALTQHPAIRESVVLAIDDARGEKRLVAYCAGNGLIRVTSGDLREFLKDLLPVHMIPSAFVFLENLPLTPNGKVDRKLLPSFDWSEPNLETAFVAPRTNIEEVLAEVWAETLGVRRVGIDDNYFTLGGDSILSIRTRAGVLDRGFDFSLQQLFEHPTIRDLAELVSVAENHDLTKSNQQPFDLISEDDRRKLPAAVADAYPLSRLQAGMVFHSEFSPDYIIYVTSLRLQLPLNIEKLQATLDQMANRHEMLRTSFALTGFSEPLQLVHQTTRLPLLVEDLRHLSPDEQQNRIAEWITVEMRNRFDWAVAPLLRFHLHLLADDAVQFTMSEPFFDGWSVASFFTEFFESYVALLDGETITGEPLLSASYKDFVSLEREALESAECRNYWTTTLNGAVASHLPRRSFTQSDADAREVMRVEVQVSAEISDGLKRLAQSIEVPLKSVLLAAHMKVVSLLTAHSDVITGLFINGRPEQADGERILGAFLNTVPLRLELSGATWTELAQRAYEAENELLPFRRYPIQELQRVHGAQQLFDAVFNYTHFHVADRLRGVEGLEVLDVDGTEQTYYPLTAQFNMDLSSRIELSLDYRTIELGEEQAREIAGYYSRVLAAMSADPEARHEAVCLLSREEERRLVVELNDTAMSFSAKKCVHELFEEQVERAPDAIAVSFGEEELSYRELNVRANKLARYLQATGVGPEVLVGIFTTRSIEMLVGLLAVLKAGGAYVPLDPEYPPERIRFMIEDSHARVVLTQNALLDRLPKTAAQTICLSENRTSQEGPLAPALPMQRGQAPLPDLFDSSNYAATQPLLEDLQKGLVQSLPENLQKEQVQPLLENLQKEQVQSLPENLQKEQVRKRGLPPLSEQRGQGPVPDLFNSENLEIRSAPDNLAYVIYTSGSTGWPKGVLVAHRGVTNMIEASCKLFGVNRDSRILQGASLSFDASVLEIFMALAGGGTLCLMDQSASGDDLAQVLRDRAITTIAITPSLLDTIPDGEFPSLQSIIAGGEASSAATATRWSRGRRLFNAYAPTEATVYATTMQYVEGDGRIPHLGRPISNMQIYLLDPHLQPVPIGITGEIHVGGVGLARGYLNRPELTAERFIPDPFSAIPGARLYKTGDLARFLDDEEIEFAGRVDQQVKLRGFRIELGEIEAVLGQHPGVREAVVVAREDVSGVKRLIAYVVTHEEPPATVEMRNYLKRTLPDYMVPSAFVVLESLPLTTTGKVDRNALPEPEQARPDLAQVYVAPRTALEEVLCSIFSEVLQVEPIGIRDNFFELGGHSLLATQISSRLREAFQMELPLRKVFEAPTVERLAEAVLNDPNERNRVEQTAELLLKLSTLSDEEAAQLVANGGSSAV